MITESIRMIRFVTDSIIRTQIITESVRMIRIVTCSQIVTYSSRKIQIVTDSITTIQLDTDSIRMIQNAIVATAYYWPRIVRTAGAHKNKKKPTGRA